VLRTTIATIDNRKIHMTATMHDVDGQLLADCTTLFIQAKPKVPEA
jgi:acyl-CoA thioesterase FadM